MEYDAMRQRVGVPTEFPVPWKYAIFIANVSQKAALALVKVGVILPDPCRWGPEVPTRLSKALHELDIHDKKACKEAIVDGRLHPGKVRNYGWHSHRAACEWVGLPIPKNRNAQPIMLVWDFGKSRTYFESFAALTAFAKKQMKK
jgi:hypothetical protein